MTEEEREVIVQKAVEAAFAKVLGSAAPHRSESERRTNSPVSSGADVPCLDTGATINAKVASSDTPPPVPAPGPATADSTEALVWLLLGQQPDHQGRDMRKSLNGQPGDGSLASGRGC